jgi:hypothetical protein
MLDDKCQYDFQFYPCGPFADGYSLAKFLEDLVSIGASGIYNETEVFSNYTDVRYNSRHSIIIINDESQYDKAWSVYDGQVFVYKNNNLKLIVK